MDALARSFTESKDLVRACPTACRTEESVANSVQKRSYREFATALFQR
jgi:hypothetical protein